MRVEVYGDDTRAYFKDHKNLINIDQYIADCGLKSDPVLPNFRSTKFECKDEFCIDFLKRRFTSEGIKWNHKKMFDKFLYQSKNRNLDDQIGVILSFLESVPTDKSLKSICKLFIKWLYDNYDVELDRSARKRIASINQIIGDETSKIERFEFNLANRYYNRGFYEQISLHAFSVRRIKTAWINDNFAAKVSNPRMLVIYALGLSYDDLAKLDVNEFSGMRHPPPVLECDVGRSVKRAERLYQRENFLVLRKLHRLSCLYYK
jgi:hypothetical protein